MEFLNPKDVHAPAGAYSHTATVSAGTELVFISGQVGMRVDGSIPATLADQAEVVFDNLRACLAAHGAAMTDVVKLTSYLVSGQDVQEMRAIRQRHFGEHRPVSTAVYVPALVRPVFLLEVEAVAVKPTR
ncbi:MAG: RidA family protein [Chitinophagaceae bacterium]|nr:RidA family protein [Rubrivivax sp.]